MEETTKNVTANEKDEQNIASEVFHEFKVQTRIAICAMAAVLAIGAILYYKNDVDWRAMFESYDFVSQDGDGINNVNGGEQGDVINGAASEIKEGQKQR